jgi:pyrrolidone-carboxylate peptidase
MSESYIEESRLALAEVSLGSLLPPDAWHPALPDEVNFRLIGEALWSSTFGKDQLDDRPLYWQRLILSRYLRELGAESSDLFEFELASRGMLGNQFSGGATYRVLVTGFDPFHLDDHIEQGNPSGVVALQHQRKEIMLGTGRAEILSMIFPVRYKDFDEFLVERVLETFTDEVDMVITVSMGRTGFDLERFPGRRRSVSILDNVRQAGGGSAEKPFVPPHLEGPEFVEFSLPAGEMRESKGDFPVNDNRLVTTLEQGEFEAVSLAALESKTAVLGSGGGYLSNEISYRLIRHIREKGSSIPAGHIHTPRMQGYDQDLVQKISEQCAGLIESAIQVLPVENRLAGAKVCK